MARTPDVALEKIRSLFLIFPYQFVGLHAQVLPKRLRCLNSCSLILIKAQNEKVSNYNLASQGACAALAKQGEIL